LTEMTFDLAHRFMLTVCRLSLKVRAIRKVHGGVRKKMFSFGHRSTRLIEKKKAKLGKPVMAQCRKNGGGNDTDCADFCVTCRKMHCTVYSTTYCFALDDFLFF